MIARTALSCLALALSLEALPQLTTAVISINDGVGGDTFIRSASASQNNNYSTIPSLNIYGWTNGGQLGIKRSFLKFDLSTIPVGAQVVAARLSLYYDPDDILESVDVHSGDNAWSIRRVTGVWDPNTVTWANQPAVTNANMVLMPATTSGVQDFEDIDVTALVQDMISTGEHGFRLSMVTEMPFRIVMLASGEDMDLSRHPVLEVDYTTSGNGIADVGPGPRFDLFWQADGALRIGLHERPEGDTYLELLDLSGRTIFTSRLKDQVSWFHVDAPAGAYAVMVRDPAGRQVMHMVHSGM